MFKRVESMLYNYEDNKVKIKNLLLDLDEVENNYDGLTGISLEERTSNTYKITSSVENEITNKERKIEKIKRDIRVREIEVEKINNILPVLNESEYKLIAMKYFLKMRHKDIAKELKYEEAYITELRTKIINRIKELV